MSDKTQDHSSIEKVYENKKKRQKRQKKKSDSTNFDIFEDEAKHYPLKPRDKSPWICPDQIQLRISRLLSYINPLKK